MQKPPPIPILGIARKLFAVYCQVVTPRKLRINREAMQNLKYRFCVYFEIKTGAFTVVHNKRVIKVAEVVEYRTAAGKPANDRNGMFPDIINIDFRHCILVSADDDAGRIPPQDKKLLCGIFQ